MELNVDALTIAGFALLPIVIWLVQSIKEAFSLDGKYLPFVGLGFSAVLMAAVTLLPALAVQVIGGSLALAVAANMSIRYVKNSGGNDKPEA